MLLITIVFVFVIVKTTITTGSINPVAENTDIEEVSVERCLLCGTHGITVSEEIKSRNLTHQYKGKFKICITIYLKFYF